MRKHLVLFGIMHILYTLYNIFWFSLPDDTKMFINKAHKTTEHSLDLCILVTSEKKKIKNLPFNW